ncbi:recombinase family protein [Nocardia sp. NPDC050697]|uniref:recombinase family protein n=1 Tax=Nocardia sp. NPDC050697 TaxID=3155158 RepID=UPI0033EA62E8
MVASIPPVPTLNAAIYCRVSRDKTGARLSVERQEADCRDLAQRLGVSIVAVLVDNDMEAYSGKPRPGYKRLLELMRSGGIATVISWHTDRIHRNPLELEEYLVVSDEGSVNTQTVKSGLLDLSTPAGRLMARNMAAFARYEVEHMKERLQAAKLQKAKEGEFRGGQRPFGFEPRRVALRDEEAQIVLAMTRAVINGSSYNAVAYEYNRRGVLTQHGKTWNAIKIKNLLERPINAGLDEHKGVLRPAKSPAIVSPGEWQALQVAIERNRRKSPHPGRCRKYPLNGRIFCGNCGKKMFHKRKQQRDGTYKPQVACGKSDPTTGLFTGCGKVSRMVAPIEDLVFESVAYRLASPEFGMALKMQESNARSIEDLRTRSAQIEARIAEATEDYYTNNLLSRDEFQRIKIQLDAAAEGVSREIASEYSQRLSVDLDLSGDIKQALANANIAKQRDVLSALGLTVYVDPRPKEKGYTCPEYKGSKFDPNLIRMEWTV